MPGSRVNTIFNVTMRSGRSLLSARDHRFTRAIENWFVFNICHKIMRRRLAGYMMIKMKAQIAIDKVTVNERAWKGGELNVKRGCKFEITGWMCDLARREAPAVVAQIDGSAETPAERTARPDVAAHFGDDAFTKAGFVLDLPTELSLGKHLVCIGSVDNGVFSQSWEATFTLVDSLEVEKLGLGAYETRLLSSSANHHFELESRFVSSMKLVDADPLVKAYGRHGDWNYHVLLWCAEAAMRLNGDFIQCGVFGGTDALAITTYVNFKNHPEKTFYLCDTFTGVPEEQWTTAERKSGADSAQWVYHKAGNLYENVVDRFRDVTNVKIIQGKVPETLAFVGSNRISLLLLDMNVAFAEGEALRILWDRIVPGGIVFSDDYGHTGGPGQGYWAQKVVFDDFAASVGLPVLSLPTGQGLIIKV